MGWQEAEIIKKWNDRMWLFCFKFSKWAHFHSYHKANGKHSILQETFMRNCQKKKPVLWKNWNISPRKPDLPLKKVRKVGFNFINLVYLMVFVLSFCSGCILKNFVCTVYITCKSNALLWYSNKWKAHKCKCFYDSKTRIDTK